MKESIKRYLVIGIIAILSINPIFANSNGESIKSTLTLKEVIEKAISKEEQISVLNKQLSAYQEKLKSTWDLSNMTYYTVKYSYDQILLQQETLKDKVAYKVIGLYQTIILLQKQIQLNELDIEIAKKELQANQIKNDKGQVSDLILSQVKLRLENKIAEKNQNERTLSDDKSQFLNITGIQLDNYENLEEDFSYETLGEEQNSLIMKNVDYYMKNTEAYAAYQKEHMVEALEYKYGTGMVTMEMWESNKADLAQNSYQVTQQRKQMIEALKTTSVELKKLEESIILQEKKISQMKDELKKVLIHYSTQYASELEKQKSEQGLKQLELAKMQNIYGYKQLKMVFEKPWIKY